MKILIPVLMMLSVSAAGAEDMNKYPSYVTECKVAATAKLKSKAAFHGGVLDESSVVVSGIDDRIYNPSKYVWFKGSARFPDGTVKSDQVLTQKSFMPSRTCF